MSKTEAFFFFKRNIVRNWYFSRSRRGPRISKTSTVINVNVNSLVPPAGTDGREHLHCYRLRSPGNTEPEACEWIWKNWGSLALKREVGTTPKGQRWMPASDQWWESSSRQQERTELEAEMGTGKTWECWWLVTNLKRKRTKETSLIEHLLYMGGHCGRCLLHLIGYAGIISI